MTLEQDPGQRRLVPHLVDEAQEVVRVTEPAHPTQDGVRRVLEGQVVVGSHPHSRGDGGDQPGSGLGRLVDTRTCSTPSTAESSQQGLEQPQVTEVLAVRRGVLADQEQLPTAGEPAGLAEDVGRTTGHERAAERRDRAERAPSVTPARELQRRHRSAVEPTSYGARAGVRSCAHRQVGGGDRVTGHHDHRGVAVRGRDRQ